MSDGEYSSASTLTCEPEPLTSSMDEPIMSTMASSSATPSYLPSPAPAASAATTRRRRGGASTSRTADRRTAPRTPVPTPGVPADPAAARRRYREGVRWGVPPPEPLMSVMPPAMTAPGLTCDPATQSCMEPASSEPRTSERPTDGASGDDSGEGSGSGSGGGAGGGPAGPGGAAGEEGEVRQGGPEPAEDRERKFQEQQEDMALAIPFTPLKVPEADTTAKRLYPLYIQVPTAGPGWTAPQRLEVQPVGDRKKIPPALADYEQQFADAGTAAKSLYETIISEGREQTAQAAQQLNEIRSEAQSSLNRNNEMLDARLADERKRLGQGESDAVHRLELIADTARLLVRLAASRVLGTLAARKAVIRARMVEAESEIANIEYTLVGFQADIARTGMAASVAFSGLSSNPAPARMQEGATGPRLGEPELTAAMNESPPMDDIITLRATNRAAAFTNGVRVFGARMAGALTQFGQSKDAALGPFQSYINMLGTTAPQQVAKMRKDAIKSIDRMEKRAKRTIQESRNTSDISLVEKHKAARAQGLVQAQASMAGQARGLERNAIGQWRSYAALASAQPQAISALKQQIAGQRSQTPEAFARFAVQASQRTATAAERMSSMRLAMLSSTAIRMRGVMGQRAAQATRMQESGAEKQAEQIQAVAQQAAMSMMQAMLKQEAAMRQSAEPIAQSVDNYKIPAAAELNAMEAALWDALGVAQQQANQAYYGGGPEGEGGESTTESPPPGTGQLPHEFSTLAESLAGAPASEELLHATTAAVSGAVSTKVTNAERNVRDQMNWSNNPVSTLAALRGLTTLQGQAVDKIYRENRGASLYEDGPYYLNVGNLTMAVSTYRFYIRAFRNYLSGNNAAGVYNEVQAAANYSNNDEQAQAAMNALAPADMTAFHRLDGDGAVLNAVAEDLGGNQATAFNILRNATEANARESVAAARSVLLTGTITTDLNRGQDSGADNAIDHMTGVAAQIGTSRLEQGDVFEQYGLVKGPEMRTGSDAVSRASDPAPLPDDYRFESSAERTARVSTSWNNTVARLGTDGTIPTDGSMHGMDWLREIASRRRSRTESRGRGHTVEVDTTIRQEQVNLLLEVARRGPDDPRVRARRFIVEETRAGGPNRSRMETALQNDAGNAGLFNPEDTSDDARRAQRLQLAEAAQRERDMYHYYDCFRQGIEDEAVIAETPRRNIDIIKRELGNRLSERAGGGEAGKLLNMQVVNGLTDPATAALAFRRAMAGAGTNEQMLKDTFGRMSPEQAAAAAAYYDKHYGPPSLYAELGIFGEGGFWTELSGDDAIDIQVLAMGRSRNDAERLERSRMTSTLHRQARDRWYSIGSWFAGDESRAMDASHAGIMNLAGVSDASFDRFGRLKRVDGRYMGRWNSDGSFAPAARDSAAAASPGAVYDSLAFAAALTNNERNVEAYKTAVDNIASTITTAIIVITAIVTTAVTFGGAASFWIPVGIALAGGLAAMAVNATLKGGRYGYEDAFRDLGMTIVQAATAGLASGLNIAAVGGKAALSAALAGRMVALGARAPSFAAQVGIGAATGAFGGAGNALFDDQAWDNGTWLSGIGHGFLRGGLSGGVSAGVTASLTTGISAGGAALAGRLGRMGGFIRAGSRGATGFSRARAAVMTGRQYANAAGNSFALSQLGRTVGGGLGGAASRYIEIEYDRSRGAYKGTRSQAMDEIYAAGIQNAIQSFGEGAAERAAENSKWAHNVQRRFIDHAVVGDADGTFTIPRRPANDNDPESKVLWDQYDRPRSSRQPPDADTRASMAAESVLAARERARSSPLPEAGGSETAAPRLPAAANDNETAAVIPPHASNDDGGITTRLPVADADAELALPAHSPLTGDDDGGFVMRTVGGDDDAEKTSPGRRRPVADEDDATPVPLSKEEQDALAQQQFKDIEAAEQRATEERARQKAAADAWKAAEQAKPPRTFQDTVDAFRNEGISGLGMQRIHATVDLSKVNLAELPYIPPNSRFIAPDATSLEAAMRNYNALMANNRNIEVLLVQNRTTGEYMVVQGDATSVRIPSGPYIVERHSHPRIINTDLEAVLVRSMPSGKDGDVGAVHHEALSALQDLPPGTIISRNSKIDIEVFDAQGNITRHETSFGVIAQGNDTIVWIEFHNPVSGKTVFEAFTSIAEYHAYALREFNVDLSIKTESTVSSVGTNSRSSPRPAAIHGDALTTAQRSDIDFIAGRMAMHDDFNAQVQGLRERGDLDPHLGRAASLEDAHARVRAMGLVGEPDSMIRLYNILNDENIPASVRALISDITLAATQRHMVETGQIEAGEPLILLFHGTTDATARDLTQNGISMARQPGGDMDDFGAGLYFTQHFETAHEYAHERGGTRPKGSTGEIIPYILRGKALENMIDVRTGGRHREAWEQFVSLPENQKFFEDMQIDSALMRQPEFLESLMSGTGVPFGRFTADARGRVFQNFIDSLGAHTGQPDIIFGDLGGPLTTGVTFRGQVTDQAAVRSHTLADIMNEQHVRQGAVASADDDAGFVVRTVEGHETETGLQPKNSASEQVAPAPKSLAQRLQSLGDSGAAAVGEAAIANMRARASKSGDETGHLINNLLKLDHPLIMRALLEPDGLVAQKLAQDFHQALLDRGIEPAIALRHMRSLEYLRIRGGARLQVEVAHQLRLAGLDDSVFDGLTSKQRRWVAESPVALALWQHDKSLFRELHAGFMRGTGRRASGNTALHFDKYVRQRLQARVKAGTDASIIPLFNAIEATRLKVLTEPAALKQFLHGRAHVITPLRPEVTTPHPPGAGVGTEITSFGAFKPGLRVVHSDPALGRGTITFVDGDNIGFTDDATGTSRLYNATEIQDQGFRLATHADPFFTDPLPLMRTQDQINAITKDIADFRTEAGLPAYVQGDKSTGTVAEIRMNGERFRGTNSGLQPENYPQSIESRRKLFERLRQAGLKSDLDEAHLGDAEFLSHAEADALLQAHTRFGALPEVVEIFVDRPTCNDCDGHLIELARMLGVKELRIYYKGEGARTTRVYR